MKYFCSLFLVVIFYTFAFAVPLSDDIATVGLWHMESVYYSDDMPYTADDDYLNQGRDHNFILFRSGLNETPPSVVPGYQGNALLFEGGQFANCGSFWSSSYNELFIEYMIYISALPTELDAAVTYLFSSSVFEMGIWPGGSGVESDYMNFKVILSSGNINPKIIIGDLKDRWLYVKGSYDKNHNLIFSILDTTTGIEQVVSDIGSYDLKATSSDITFGSTRPSVGSKPANRNFRGMIDEIKITHLSDIPHYAFKPFPADNSTILEIPEALKWSKGYVADSSDIYFGGSSSIVNNAQKLSGDIDGSRFVDINDFGHMASSWQQKPFYPCADLDLNGQVDFTDLAILAYDWLNECDSTFLGSTQEMVISDPEIYSLLPETTYYWRVASANCSEIDEGNIWQFTTGSSQATSPSPENGESYVEVDSNSVELRWTPGFGAESFDIYFGTSIEPEYYTTSTEGKVYSPSLLPNTTYYWRIDSINDNNIYNGNLWRFTTGQMQAVSPSPSNGETEVKYPLEAVQLSWDSGFQPDSFVVYFGTQNPPDFYMTTSHSSILSPVVEANTKYYWQVKCISASGTSISSVWQFTTTTPAFTFAEGFGRFAKGGRGGSVYHVTNLNDSGSGSLRDAVSQSDRTIVFDVGGQITLSSRLSITANRLTIAGQTAPGEGISIVGPGVSIGADDLIMRYLRIRYTNNSEQDDALSLNDTCSDNIYDHLSVSWGTDEVFSMNKSQNITAQWCMITEGQNILGHSKGSLLEMPVLSMHHCLYAHNNDRNPKNKGEFDYRNNVAYDWGFAPYIAGGNTGAQCHANCIGNYYIAGSSTTTDDGIMVITGNSNYHLYFNDNRIDSNRDGIANAVDLGYDMLEPDALPDIVSIPYEFPPVQTDSPELAYQRVLSQVGCWQDRDSTDERIIDQVVTQTGGIIYSYEDVGGPSVISGGIAPQDSDQDGMPDHWENSIAGLNSMAADNNGDLDNDGYTNLEEYLNWLACSHGHTDKNTQIDIDLEYYTSGFETGTYTISNINNGSAVLLADGHTVSFIPANDFVGLASFDFTIETDSVIFTDTVSVLVSGEVNSYVTIIIQENESGYCSVDSGGSIDSNNSGFTGDGFVNTQNAVGEGVNWSVEVAQAGVYTISWRYANGSSDRPGIILVDAISIEEVSFPGTGDWTTWSQVSKDLYLTVGIHSIRLQAVNSGGLANIDYIMINGADIVPSECQ